MLSIFALLFKLSPTTMATEDTLSPSELDILCGRGKESYRRPGNKRLLCIVHQYVPLYSAAKSKVAKDKILNAIMDDIRSNEARFLERNNGSWCELSELQAREKIGLAIRGSATKVDGAMLKDAAKSVFAGKQHVLLAQQSAIFEYLIRNL
jgi:hypothetical protein